MIVGACVPFHFIRIKITPVMVAKETRDSLEALSNCMETYGL